MYHEVWAEKEAKGTCSRDKRKDEFSDKNQVRIHHERSTLKTLKSRLGDSLVKHGISHSIFISYVATLTLSAYAAATLELSLTEHLSGGSFPCHVLINHLNNLLGDVSSLHLQMSKPRISEWPKV